MPPGPSKELCEAQRLNVTPDPEELRRRIDKDQALRLMQEKVVKLEEERRAQVTVILKDLVPVQTVIKKLMKQRAVLLTQIRNNQQKMVSIRERARRYDHPERRRTRARIEGRKRVIKEGYIKQLLLVARSQLSKSLQVMPPLAKQPTPPVNEADPK